MSLLICNNVFYLLLYEESPNNILNCRIFFVCHRRSSCASFFSEPALEVTEDAIMSTNRLVINYNEFSSLYGHVRCLADLAGCLLVGL